MPKELKMQRVQEIINVLQLQKCQNTVMGSASVPGLSGGERKRASIALELLTNPLVLLLDEPTSGLDYAIAYEMMSMLSDYTQKTNKTVVVTIHQPSSQIFHMFSQLLLLSDGKTAYFGAADKVLDFFSHLGLHCNPHYNPADFMLEQMVKSSETTEAMLALTQKNRKTEWPIHLRDMYTKADDSINPNGLLRRLSNISFETLGLSKDKAKSSSSSLHTSEIIPEDGPQEVIVTGTKRHSIVETDVHLENFMDRSCKWPTGFWTQYSVLTMRILKQAKHRILAKINIAQAVTVTIFSVLLWFQLDRSEQTMRDRMGMLFFSVVYWGFVGMMIALNAFPDERPVINRERAAGTYRLSAYYLAKMTSELPLSCLMPLIYTTITYWSTGLMYSAQGFFVVLFMIIFFSLTLQGLGIAFGCAINDYSKCLTAGMCYVLVSMLAGGYYMRNLPQWALVLQYVSIVNYAYQPLLIQEFGEGDPLLCLPSNQTFYASCINDTHVSGQEVLGALDTLPNWVNYTVLAVYFIAVRISGYLFLRFVHHPGGVK